MLLHHGSGACFFMDWPGTRDHMGPPTRARVAAILPAGPTGVPSYRGIGKPACPPRHPPPSRPRLPALAAQLRQSLDAAGIPDAQAPAPGLDHGVFIPVHARRCPGGHARYAPVAA
ncbi:hypothetical protein RAA17_12760 [Komagataeibacter rhaeticus]|nr:hypothetical protein [Komagataeibacter rhaeticus]